MYYVREYVEELQEKYGDAVKVTPSTYDAETLQALPEKLRAFYEEYKELEAPFCRIFSLEEGAARAAEESEEENWEDGWICFGYTEYEDYWKFDDGNRESNSKYWICTTKGEFCTWGVVDWGYPKEISWRGDHEIVQVLFDCARPTWGIGKVLMIKRGKKIFDFEFLKKVVEVFKLDTDCYDLSDETVDMPYVVKDGIMKDDALAAIKEVGMPGTLLFVRRAGYEHGHKDRDYILAGEKFPNINFDTDDSEYGASYLAPVPKGEFIHTSAIENLYQLKSYISDCWVDQWRSRDEDPVWLSYDEDLKTDSPHEYVKKLIAIFKCGYPDPRELSYLLGDSHAYTQGRIIAKDGFWSGYRQLEKYEKEHGKGSAGKDYCKNIKAVICYIDREKKDVKKIEMKIDVDYKWQRVHTLNIHFKDSVDLRKIHSKLKKDVKDIEMEITPERLAITHNAFKFNLFGSDSSKDGGPFKGLFGKSK